MPNDNGIQKIKRVLNNKNFWNVVYVIFLLIVISAAFGLTVCKYDDNANRVNDSYAKRDSIIEKGIFAVNLDEPEIKQLKDQFNMIAEIKGSYLFVTKSYIKYNYSFVIFFTIFSIISGILVFLIMKKGWDGTDSFYLKATFLIVFFFSTLFGILPNIFATKDNIKNNLEKYNYYSGLQLDIYDLVQDNKGYIKRIDIPSARDSLNKEILLIAKGIKENQNLYFDIHIDKVPTEVKPLK